MVDSPSSRASHKALIKKGTTKSTKEAFFVC